MLRLVADCAPPHYIYFIQQTGIWDEASVREGRLKHLLGSFPVNDFEELFS